MYVQRTCSQQREWEQRYVLVQHLVGLVVQPLQILDPIESDWFCPPFRLSQEDAVLILPKPTKFSSQTLGNQQDCVWVGQYRLLARFGTVLVFGMVVPQKLLCTCTCQNLPQTLGISGGQLVLLEHCSTAMKRRASEREKPRCLLGFPKALSFFAPIGMKPRWSRNVTPTLAFSGSAVHIGEPDLLRCAEYTSAEGVIRNLPLVAALTQPALTFFWRSRHMKGFWRFIRLLHTIENCLTWSKTTETVLRNTNRLILRFRDAGPYSHSIRCSGRAYARTDLFGSNHCIWAAVGPKL